MAQSRICPTCLSEYPDIHGMIYPCGSYIGTPCADSWHKGPEYDPDTLKLSEDDIAFLSLAKIAV